MKRKWGRKRAYEVIKGELKGNEDGFQSAAAATPQLSLKEKEVHVTGVKSGLITTSQAIR